jgi:pimeloyl-ACP methyl ester carboxylesterase
VRLSALGQELDYETRGEGRAAVCIPGLTVDRRILVAACEATLDRPGVRRLYLDLPGQGASTGDAAQASADVLLEGLYQLARTAGPRPLILGYSYGGYLAQALCAALGDVGGLFLACPVLEPDLGRRHVPPRRVVDREELRFADDGERDGFGEIAVVQSAAALERFRRVVHPANVATDRAVVEAIRRRYVVSQPFLGALFGLTCPVSIVCGRDDHWAGYEDALPLLRALPNAELTVLPGCGHLLPLEAGPRFARLVADWLDRALAA